MKRISSHSLKFITGKKKSHLDDFFSEYTRVVNEFIDVFWNEKKLPSKINSTHYHQIDSWLLGKVMKCAGNQSLQIIRSTWKRNSEVNYKVYKRVYKKLMEKGKINSITSQKWSTWNKTVELRKRISKPEFSGSTIELNSDLVTIYDKTRISSFDLIVRLGSIFGNRFSLILPTKQHKQSNKLLDQGFVLRKSIRLRKNKLGNYVLDLYWEKPTEELKQTGEVIGVDVGINKLMTLSDGTFVGKEIKLLISKLNRRKQKSKGWYRTLEEIKSYISKCVKELPIDKIKTIVVENIKNITHNTKGKTSKSLRKQLGHWNLNLLWQRLSDWCELNRIQLSKVNPAYTSQICSSCGHSSAESRSGELYKCVKCGLEIDSDLNGSYNIRNRYQNRKCTVSYEQETTCISLHNFG